MKNSTFIIEWEILFGALIIIPIILIVLNLLYQKAHKRKPDCSLSEMDMLMVAGTVADMNSKIGKAFLNYIQQNDPYYNKINNEIIESYLLVFSNMTICALFENKTNKIISNKATRDNLSEFVNDYLLKITMVVLNENIAKKISLDFYHHQKPNAIEGAAHALSERLKLNTNEELFFKDTFFKIVGEIDQNLEKAIRQNLPLAI